MPLNQMLLTKPVLGQKKDKTRITVLLGVNATGTDKLSPWAWMNSSIFEEVLRHINSYFRAQNKKVLLLVDNAPSHFDPHTFSDVMAGQDANFDSNDDSNDNNNDIDTGGGRDTFWLNLTHIESLDAGIIKSFKAHYKRNYCQHILKLFEEGKDINKKKVNIKKVIDYLADAWENVTDETIFNSDTDQVIEDLSMESDVPFASSLAGALNDFFNNLEEEIPTEDILDENNIIKLVQEEMDENEDNSSDDSENVPELVSLNDATKSLQTWMTFFK
ncbi:hypothetical protein RclHR1_22610001 [Rhizophagus clarus]|uniref:DDE-1 domain-containing protein n=1 Tax=Rhizophagus clarus TaxID=94130 RepID=A0A2Z6RPB0_9GLOM|nr:hypothetical protein RclHR1_22610001 [Rhizophagus clarus]